MRKLQTKDVFRFARILKRADLTNEILKITNTEGMDAEKIGMHIISICIDGCADVNQEKAIYEFLGDITEKGAEAIESLSLDVLFEDLKTISKENDLVTFFKSAQQLTQ